MRTMYTYVICAYNVMYGTVYSAHTPVPTHHTQLYFAIEPDRRTLILILIRIQYTVNDIISLSIYMFIDSEYGYCISDTCTVHSYSLMSCYSTDTDLVTDTDTDAACKLLNIHTSCVPCFHDVCALRT